MSYVFALLVIYIVGPMVLFTVFNMGFIVSLKIGGYFKYGVTHQAGLRSKAERAYVFIGEVIVLLYFLWISILVFVHDMVRVPFLFQVAYFAVLVLFWKINKDLVKPYLVEKFKSVKHYYLPHALLLLAAALVAGLYVSSLNRGYIDGIPTNYFSVPIKVKPNNFDIVDMYYCQTVREHFYGKLKPTKIGSTHNSPELRINVTDQRGRSYKIKRIGGMNDLFRSEQSMSPGLYRLKIGIDNGEVFREASSFVLTKHDQYRAIRPPKPSPRLTVKCKNN